MRREAAGVDCLRFIEVRRDGGKWRDGRGVVSVYDRRSGETSDVQGAGEMFSGVFRILFFFFRV